MPQIPFTSPPVTQCALVAVAPATTTMKPAAEMMGYSERLSAMSYAQSVDTSEYPVRRVPVAQKSEKHQTPVNDARSPDNSCTSEKGNPKADCSALPARVG